MSFFRGIALVMKDGQPVNVASYKYLGEGTILSIPVSIIIFAVIVAAVSVDQLVRAKTSES